MIPFELIAGICLFIIALMLVLSPFLILNKLEQIRLLIKSQDDRSALQDYKSQLRSESTEP
jgi:hypothetical protein